MEERLERIARDVVDQAMKLHMKLGPGLLESVYAVIMEHKLKELGYEVEREQPVPVRYEGIDFEIGFRADLVVDGCFIVELKSVEKVAPVHGKQLLTYLKLTGLRLGCSSTSVRSFSNTGSSESRTDATELTQGQQGTKKQPWGFPKKPSCLCAFV